jgi:K+-transporting ATPase ATPase C chain
MLSELKPAILITILFTVLTGILYPLAVTGIAQASSISRRTGA